MELEYKLARTAPPTPNLVERVLEQFRTAGCRAR
jgi:pyruvate formate lyase activating enzyme